MKKKQTVDMTTALHCVSKNDTALAWQSKWLFCQVVQKHYVG